jgi:hypothetical protein
MYFAIIPWLVLLPDFPIVSSTFTQQAFSPEKANSFLHHFTVYCSGFSHPFALFSLFVKRSTPVPFLNVVAKLEILFREITEGMDS